MIQQTRLATGLALSMLILFGCAQKRDAAFPSETSGQIFAISDFGSLDPNGGVTVRTQANGHELTEGEKSRALYAQGIVPVVSESATVSAKMRFMFEDLELLEKPGTALRVVFAVAPDFVTAYKIVSSKDDLNLMERGLAVTFEQVQAELGLQRTKEPAQINQLNKQIQLAREQRSKELSRGRVTAPALVPLFKFKVESFGTVARKKNEMKEDTATLELRKSRWTEASHVQIKNDSSGRVAFLPSATKEKRQEQERVFIAAVVTDPGRAHTVGSLNEEFGITLGEQARPINDDEKVTLALDEKTLTITDAAGGVLGKVAVQYVVPCPQGVAWQPGVPLEKEIELHAVKTGESSDLVQIPKGEAQTLKAFLEAEAKKKEDATKQAAPGTATAEAPSAQVTTPANVSK